MNGNDVRRLETLARDAIVNNMAPELPRYNKSRTIELMAKAAVAARGCQ